MRTTFFAALVAVLFLAAACRQAEPQTASSADVSITMAVEPQPAAVGTSTLTGTVTGANGAAVGNVKVAARGDMSHAGMVPVTGEAETGADGSYTIPFEWTMAGDWFVDITVTLPDGQTVQERFDVSVSGEAADHADDDHTDHSAMDEGHD